MVPIWVWCSWHALSCLSLAFLLQLKMKSQNAVLFVFRKGWKSWIDLYMAMILRKLHQHLYVKANVLAISIMPFLGYCEKVWISFFPSICFCCKILLTNCLILIRKKTFYEALILILKTSFLNSMLRICDVFKNMIA